MPYGDIDGDQCLLRQWLAAWWHQTIIWIIIDFSLVRFCGIYLRTINLLHKSHNVPFPYPTMYHFVTEMYTCAHFCYKMVHCGIFVWCIVGFVRLVYFTAIAQATILYNEFVNYAFKITTTSPRGQWVNKGFKSPIHVHWCRASTVEVWDWISNFMQLFIMDVITYPCWDLS